jgi:hypothetical protein
MKCWGCDSDGSFECPVCEGLGRVENDEAGASTGPAPDLIECSGCGGSGRMKCVRCAGRGAVPPYDGDDLEPLSA